MRIKIPILYGTEPNFEKQAFQYFILYVNKIQTTYEFCFPDVGDYPLEKGIVNFETSQNKVSDFIEKNELIGDHFITIISNSFNNNYFTNTTLKISIITTDIWEKHFSPPSLFEYLLHSIFACLIYSKVVPKDTVLMDDQMLIQFDSHEDSRGCIADFNRKKFENRIGIALGYICEEHSILINRYFGASYLKELQFVIERNWIGRIEEKESVAFNLKHIFKFNINKDSGFIKTRWDELKDKFYEIPGTLTLEVIKTLILAILGYYLYKLGIKIKD